MRAKPAILSHYLWVANRSEGAQEFEKSFLFAGLELFKFFGDVSGFATVAPDGVEKSHGRAVVHQARVQADAPERGGADFVRGIVKFGDGKIFPCDLVHVPAVMLGHGHDDAVACSDIVEQEVSIGVKLLFAERGRNGEGAAVDLRAGWGSRQRLDVANIAADLVE